MSRLETVARQSGRVVSDGPSGLSVRWQARTLTSQPNTMPRTYSAWSDQVGLPSRPVMSEVFDQDRGVYKRVVDCGFRIRVEEQSLIDASGQDVQPIPPYTVGDQLMDLDGQVWTVTGQNGGGAGTIKLALGREIGLIAAGEDRKQGA